jgi:amino acid adenylation domain-containing protein
MSTVEPRTEGLSRLEKVALLERLERQRPGAARTFPLSFAQQRMWFLDRLEPGNPANNIFRAVTFSGDLDAAILARVLSAIVRRHAALRTVFPTVGDEPRQRVTPATELALPRVDLSALPVALRAVAALDLAGREARHAFDLARGPLFRAALVRLDASEHVLFLGLHHIVADGWSLGLLYGELATLYRAFVSVRPSPLPALSLPYPEFAVWQRERMAGERLRAELDWWREEIGEAATVLELPADRLRSAVESFRGDLERFALPVFVENGVRALGRGSQATLFMTLLAAFEVLLCRYTRQPSFLVGTTVAGRHRPEVEEVIGFFANTLLLPAGLSGDPTFRALLGSVRRSTLAAYGHQELPFESLVEELHPERDLSHNPLFQVMFALQNLPEQGFSLPGLTVSELDVERGLSKLDLTLDLTDSKDGIAGYFEYSTDLFEPATIARMRGCFLTLLAGIVAAPDRPLSALPLLDRAERERILFGWNPTGSALPPSVPERIAAQARRTPEAPAVLCGDERLGYAELNARANRLARYLRRRGVGPDTRVGLCLERSLGLTVALLGILKAGAAYVPLDPDYPRERLALMIEDTGMPVLLTISRLAARLPVEAVEGDGPALLLLDAEGERIAAEDAADPDWEILGEGLAYVVYTSGSTGRPKGVGVPHRALANHAAECARWYGLRPADRVLQFTSISFDITSEEIFPTWISGAALVPRAPGLFPSFAELEALLDRHGVTVVNLPTAYWHEWASELHRLERRPPESLRLAIVGTEQALPERLAEWLTLPTPSGLPRLPGNGVRFANSYASTECTVTALIHLSGPGSLERARAGHRIPVGRPIGNCRVYVLDGAMEPVPVGVPGDVYIGGANVSRGYLRHPERTAAVFLPDPFATGEPGGRLYRQGDLGRFLPSGELECLGRSDDQVKIRGFRVEPGEIEAVLARHPGVRECVVLVRDGAPGFPGTPADRRLVGYVAADPDHRATPEELRLHLKKSLPEYMVPAGLVVLDDLPLTSNGKLDRRALLRIDAVHESIHEVGGAAGMSVPGSPVEELMLQIWSQVLRRERIGMHDNFFDLGGHSLLATQVISRVRQALGVDLPLRTLFEEPTVAALAAAVEAARRSTQRILAPPIEPIAPELRSGPLPSSFAQQRLWVVDQLMPGSPAYNLADALRWEGALDVATLSRALDEIVRRHEVLRTTFAVMDGQAVQVIAPPAPLELRRVDVTAEPATPATSAETALLLAAEEGRRPFDLGRGPLFRATLYRLAPEDHLLLLGIHHSVSDGNSNQILLRELLALYTAFSRGEVSPLPDLPVQYADYAAWQRAWLRGEALAVQIAYWRQQLAGAPPILELPIDRPRPAVETADGARHTFTLPPALARDLATLGRREGATRFMTLLAGFDALLARESGQDDVVVGWPIAGRGHAEVDSVIGFFSNMLVQRARMEEGASFARLLGQVRGTALDAYSHGDLPFELLVEALRPERDLSHNPIFQVFFVLHHQATDATDGADAGAQPVPGAAVHLPHVATGTSLLDLSLAVTEMETALEAVFEYKTALFDGATVERLAGHLTNLLASAVEAPGAPLAELPILSAAERRQLFEVWNDTAEDVPVGTTAHGLFAARAAAAPGDLALVCDEELLSYGDLEARANRLAHRLRRLGVGPGVLVGICLERGAAMVAALLAVLKSGGAYVPLDPTYPAERLAYVLADGGIRFLLTTGDLAAVLPLHDAAVLDLDGDMAPAALLAESAATPVPLAGPEDLAYVLYTSGSTGKPKGVEVRHAGLANFLLSMARRPGLTAADTFLAVTTISFDIAGLEIYLPLAVGGRVVLASRAAAADGRRLAALLADCGATAMQATPATWRLLLDSGWVGKEGLKALSGGEALPAELARELLSRVGSLWNVYGPTETTIWSALQPVTALRDATSSTVPIGLPIANTTLHLLDRKLGPMAPVLPVPVGVVGELYIGGAGLARGYLRRPALTAERFVPDPFAGPGARLYRTGDLARRLGGGEIEFLGRADTQVKVRGFRIELGEIEAALAAHEAVRQAVVAVRAESAQSSQLVAYVVAAGPAANPGNLRAALREELPEYMVPSLFVFLTELPLTPNGKVDRKALPSPAADPLGRTRERVAPRTPVELRVAEIWAEILGVQGIGIHDNFFELGGHSLMATQVISRLEEAFGIELGLPAIFKTPTVAALSEAIMTREVARTDDELLTALLAQLED